MEIEDIIDVEDLIEVGYRFSELGAAIAEASYNNDRLFNDALNNLQTLQKMTDSLSTDTLERIRNEVGINIAYAPELMNTYEESIMSADTVFESLSSSIKQFRDSLGEVSRKPGEPLVLGRPEDPSKKATKDQKDKKKSLLREEFKNASSMLKGFAAKLAIPLPGAVLGGLAIWLAMGFKRRQRIEAEAGEVKNILVSATDATVEGVIGKATSYLSGLQEHLHKEYGIARKDFQGVIKSFVDGGVEVERVLEKVGGGLGKAGENTLLLTYAVDKMFELPGGTSAKLAVQIMAEYGDTLEEARESVVDLAMAGREAGIGVSQFMKNIIGAGDDLKEFGFGIDAVADLTLTLQERFEALGVPRQFAGRQAAIGMKQMASGLVNMSMDWQMFIAERAGYGTGLAARQAMISAQQRVAREGSDEELLEMYRVLGGVAMEVAGGDETLARQVLEQSMGLGFEGALSAIEILKAINEGDVVSAKKIAQEREKDLRDALTTEKSKRNQWELQMNNWMDAISMMGEGILAGISKVLAHVIVFGKSALTLISNYIAGRDEANERLLGDINTFMSSLNFSTGKFAEGLDKLEKSAQEMGLNILGDSAKAIKAAVEWEPPGTTVPRGVEQGVTPPLSPFMGVGGVVPPLVQTVTVPVSEPGTYEIGRPPIREEREAVGLTGAGAGVPKEWVGGKLSIISSGADPVGNIKLTLVGNCPQCGLRFGGVSKRGREERIEIYNPNIQKSIFVDPTTVFGMEALSKLAVGGKARRGRREVESLDPRLGKVIRQISEEYPGKRVRVFRGTTGRGGKGEHAMGRAIDVGVEGVKSEELFRFLMANVKGGGKGLYPEQPFVHVDVRPGSAVWVDFSKKGEKGGRVIGGMEALTWLKSTKNRERLQKPPSQDEESVELAGREAEAFTPPSSRAEM